MRRTILHVGTAKTGTTSIQAAMGRNRNTLLESNIDFPRVWGENHIPVALLAYSRMRWDDFCTSHATRLGVTTKRLLNSQRDEVRLRMMAELLTSLEVNPEKDLLFSSELLWEYLNFEDIQRLAKLMRLLGLDAEIVVYLRDPLSYAVSRWSEFTKAGHIDPFGLPSPGVDVGDLAKPEHNPWLGAIGQGQPYLKVLAWWERAFPGKVNVRLYDNSALVGGDVVSDFCSVLGVPVSDDIATVKRLNESLTWTELKVLNAINGKIPFRDSDGYPNPKRFLFSELPRLPGDSYKFHPTVEQVEAYETFFSSSSRSLQVRYFPERPTLWSMQGDPRERRDVGVSSRLSAHEEALVAEMVDGTLSRNDGVRPPPEIASTRKVRDQIKWWRHGIAYRRIVPRARHILNELHGSNDR